MDSIKVMINGQETELSEDQAAFVSEQYNQRCEGLTPDRIVSNDTEYICPNCGNTLLYDSDLNYINTEDPESEPDKFCSHCGAKISWKHPCQGHEITRKKALQKFFGFSDNTIDMFFEVMSQMTS